VQPLLGRTFNPTEDVAGANRVVVLSYGLWQRRFARDRTIIGCDLVLDGAHYKVIGVMPREFRFSIGVKMSKLVSPPVDFWTPWRWMRPSKVPGAPSACIRWPGSNRGFRMHRPRPRWNLSGVRFFKANDLDMGMTSRIATVPDEIRGDLRQPLWILSAAVACVLLIACANLAGLLIARGATRRREIGIRMAAGASRARIVQQLLLEALLLAIPGGTLGLLCSGWFARLALLVSPGALEQQADIALDWRVAAFAGALTIVAAVFFGLVPARRLSGADLSGVLGESGRTFTDSRSETLRSAFVIAQISLTVVVLAAAMLLVKSLFRVLSNDSGFTRQNILSMDIPLSASRYPDAQRESAFFEQALSRVQALPGVITAAIIDSAPFTQSRERFVQIEDEPVHNLSQLAVATTRAASPGYLAAMGISLRAGR
jgi:putative ABC transport system permease protein